MAEQSWEDLLYAQIRISSSRRCAALPAYHEPIEPLEAGCQRQPVRLGGPEGSLSRSQATGGAGSRRPSPQAPPWRLGACRRFRRRCLFGLAGLPTAAFAQTNTLSIVSVAGDNEVTASEKWNGFDITGHTGDQVNIPVELTFGTETWNTTSTTLIDGNYWWSVTVEDDETGDPSYITHGANQTVSAEATFSGGIKLSHSRTFNVDLTLPLVVDAVTGDDVINDDVIRIMGNTGDIGSVRIDLVLGTGSFINTSDLDGEWLQAVSAAENQSYITGSNASLSVTATKTGYEPSATVSRTLTKDLVHPSVSYTAPLSLQVGVEITPITPTTSDTDIVSYLFSNPLPGLSLNGGTGVISGTPTTVNDSMRTSTVIATDAADNDGTATIDFPPVVAGTLTLNVDDDIAGDDTINIAEKASGFTIGGDTGTESGVTVTATIGGTALTSVTSAIEDGQTDATWTVTVDPDRNYITETSVELSVTATKPNYTSMTVTRTLTVELTAPTVSYTAPSSLEVGEAITAMVPTTNDTDIDSYAISSDSLPLPRGLSLNGTTGVISGTPTTGNPNTQTVAVLATDKTGNTGTADIQFLAVDGPEPGVTDWRLDPSMSLKVPEGGSAQYTLVLDTEPTHDVTITVNVPVGDEDLTAAPTSLTFTSGNWHEEQTVTVSAAEDDDGMAGVRNFTHLVASDDSIYDDIRAPGVRAEEVDNDPIGVTIWPQVLRMPDGGSREYTVVLNTPPKDEVRITVTRDMRGDTDLTATPEELTFSVLNWSTAQTVTVSAAPDADQVNGVAIFAHSAASDDEDYYDIPIDSVTAIEDETRPRVEIQTEASAPVGGPFEVTIGFSEPVEGFELEDIEVSNGTASNFNRVSSRTYTMTITPEETGEVRVEVESHVARDGVGNRNRAAEPLVIEADLERPEVTIEGPTQPVGMAGFEVTITFSEAVTGFESSDIQVINGTVADFTEVSSREYRATIRPAEAGPPVMVKVPENGVDNGNQAAALTIETVIEVSYAAASYTATEGGDAVTVAVQLSRAGDQALAIPIRVKRPETTEVGDYTVGGLQEWDAQAGTGTLTFPADEMEQAFRIAANHDGDEDDETVDLGFGELPETVLAGEPSVAIVTLVDKGLLELEVSFGQAAYVMIEGQKGEIEVTVSPPADRRVEVPLVVALQGGTAPEDYTGIPASVVFEAGESRRTISVEVLADDVDDPGEGIVLSLGGLAQAVSAGDPFPTQVQFEERRKAERFSQTLEGMAAVIARSTAVSAQTAIEGRFERHRQWSRLGSTVGALSTAPSGSDNSAAALSPRESEWIGRAGGRDVEGPVVHSAWGAAGTSAATGSAWNAEHGGSGAPGSWLRRLSLGSLGNLARFDPAHRVASPGSGMAPSGSVYRQDLDASGVGAAPLAPGSGDFSGMRDQAFSLSGVSFELSSGAGEAETSWVPVLWGQGDVQHFNGDLRRLGMAYRGGLEAAYVGLDLYATDEMLAGLSFMRSWGDVEYTADGLDGVLESRLTTVHPYLYWQLSDRLSVWGIGGLGGGQVAVEEPGRTHDFDADFRMLSGGVRAVLSRRGSHEWGLRIDAFTAQLETAALADIARVSGESHRGRLLLDWVHDKALSVGRSLSVQVEAGGRFDGGDAERGNGLETGVRLGYLDARRGLDVALHGRVLLVHASDYRDWGVGVQASWDPGEKQRGFRASVTSSWGRDGGGRTTLWDNADSVMRPAGLGAMGSQYRMESEVAYAGVKALGLPGLLTPYSRLRWGGQGRELALGTAWSLPTGSQQALPLLLELETIRREAQTGPADLAVLARLSLPF